MAVIQLVQRRRHRAEQPMFSDADLQLAHRLGTEVIGLRLDSLRLPQFIADVDRWLDWTDQLVKLQTEAPAQFLNQLQQMLSMAIPEGEGRKLYGAFLWDETQEGVSQSAVGGRLKRSFEGSKQQLFRDGLAGRSYSDRVAFWSEPLGGRIRGGRRLASAVCGIACGIGSGSRSAGLLMVESDHYDLSEEREGRLLECLSQEAARALSLRERPLASPAPQADIHPAPR